MTRNDVVRLLAEAEITVFTDPDCAVDAKVDDIQRLLDLAQAEQRDKDARLCEATIIEHGNWKSTGHQCATAIRAQAQATDKTAGLLPLRLHAFADEPD